jgi:hypothetical protein
MVLEKQCEAILTSAYTAGGASIELIESAEQELNVSFPAAYRKFLERYGAAVGMGFRIAGLFKSDEEEMPIWEDIVLVTKRTRRALQGWLPDTLLPISSDGASLTFYIDATGGEECPVIAYGPGVDGLRVAESFEEFVIKASAGNIDSDAV